MPYNEQVQHLRPDRADPPGADSEVAFPRFLGLGGGESAARTVQRRDTDGARPLLEESAHPIPFTPVCGDGALETDPRHPAPSVGDQDRADEAIIRLERALSHHREQVARNQIDNLRRYLKETGGEGAIAMSKGALLAKVSGAMTKSTATSFGKMGLDNVIAHKLASLASRTLGLATSLGLSVLYDVVAHILFDPTGKALRAAYRSGHASGVDTMFMAQLATVVARVRQEGEDQLLAKEFRMSARRASSIPALEGLVGWVDQQVPMLMMPVVDTALFDALIETWVLQRAGDEEDANKHTDQETYESIHKRFAPDGNLSRRDLFIHQCRFELGRLGVVAEPILSTWEAKLEAQPRDLPSKEVIARLGPLYLETDRFGHPERLAQYLGERFAWDDDFDLMPTDEERRSHEQRLEGSPMERGREHVAGRVDHVRRAAENQPRFLRTVRTGGARLACSVKLTEADGAIFVDWYIYRLEGTRHDAKGSPLSAERLNDAKVPTRIWTDSPT